MITPTKYVHGNNDCCIVDQIRKNALAVQMMLNGRMLNTMMTVVTIKKV